MERSLTIAKCVSAPLLINQKAGENELIKSIFLIIRRFNDLVNVSRKLNEDQMIALAADFYERFSGESLEDVMLFFKMARNGDFGDIYRLDSIVILAWVPQYLEKKIEAFHDSRISEENARIRAENDAVQNHEYSEKSVEMLEELSRRLKTATVSRNTGVLRKDNPLFDYSEYLKTLPETIQKKDDEFLETMIGNTSKYSHPEVYKILMTEKEIRDKSKPIKKTKK
ncbi:hypothetical protein ASG31_08315 [Chryseobacterium sp. Leaf404]|uniref:hypothetical protein n=1 Tax=unclassified Chryseobacterium TaxID=2593645 RepID=UPI0006F356BA|nr:MULTISPECIES: hypothetical protein [unclassified Chryseobacterium]KQT17405.1 hypothetical protein ASG31_08315 [Chryseobacterium sp. Leaf404]